MRARVVHPVGHHNGGETVSGQRYRAHDTVSVNASWTFHILITTSRDRRYRPDQPNADNAFSRLCCRLAINVWRRWRAKEIRRRKKFTGELPDTVVETLRRPKQWQLDYQLEDTGPLGLYQEYSEMGNNRRTRTYNT